MKYIMTMKNKVLRFIVQITNRLTYQIMLLWKYIYFDSSKYKKLITYSKKISLSNGCIYYKKFNIDVGLICDSFIFDAYKDAANITYISPIDDLSNISKFDFVIIVSTWRGIKNSEWLKMAEPDSSTNKRAHEIIEYAKTIGKTVVFYNKEDPPNYDYFLNIAKECDFIFTSCVEKIHNYKIDCSNQRVYPLEFCFNPILNNPIGIKNPYRDNSFIFSGSWMKKYPKRIRDMENMFDEIIKIGQKLVFIDRNYNCNDIRYMPPVKYFKYVFPEIEHDLLARVHKLFDWSVNFNSITNSKTMFANRVYEMQANGNLLVSNQSIGMENKFHNIVVYKNTGDLLMTISDFSKEDIYNMQLSCVRDVFRKDTCFHRMEYILSILGYNEKIANRNVLVVVDSINENILEMFNLQTYTDKKIINLNELTYDIYSNYDIVGYWNSKDYYGIYYLEDMINGFKYTKCSYVTKSSTLQHDYTDIIENKYATVVWRETVSYEEFLNLNNNMNVESAYCIDNKNYENR